MKIFQFINNADKKAGGAQNIAHHIHSIFPESKLCGFDFFYQKNIRKKSNIIFCFIYYLYCALCKRKSLIVIHHRIFLILNIIFRHKKSYFICHNIFPDNNFIFKLNTCVRYIAISDAVYDYLYGHCQSADISKIYNGIEVDIDSYRKVSHQGNDEFLIYYIGRLSDQKGVESLVDTFKKFAEKRSNVYLRIIGDGENLDELLEKADGYLNIEFLGKKNFPFRNCIDADVVIVPSIYEGFGLVYYEALEYGHYVLASNLKVFEVFPDENCVRFFELGNIESMYEALSETYCLELSKVKRIEKRHRFQSVEVMKSEYRELFERCYE